MTTGTMTRAGHHAVQPVASSRRERRLRAPRRRRVDPIIAGALCVIGMGLGMAGGFGWDIFGTTAIANRAEAAAVSEYRARIALVDTDADLHTNFDAFPPPLADTSGTDAWGLLIVPSWAGKTGVYGEALETAMPIKEGTTKPVLDSGAAGHFIGSVPPGQVGNFALAGHRRSYGDNFLHVPDLEVGDRIVVETSIAWFVYEVTDHEIVEPSQWEVVAPVPGDPDAGPTERLITLTTCHSLKSGAWGNDHRWVVHGELVGWVEHDAGVPTEALEAN